MYVFMYLRVAPMYVGAFHGAVFLPSRQPRTVEKTCHILFQPSKQAVSVESFYCNVVYLASHRECLLLTKHFLLLLTIKIGDGANSSSSLLKTFCNSNPGPSVFLSSGTQMWVEYSSTQSSNSFEASFKKRLDPSCKSFFSRN